MKLSKSRKIAIHIIIISSIIYGSTIFREQKATSPKICLDSHCLNVAIADTNESREKGLMFIKSMPEESGMLFVFNKEGLYPFWMKDTVISLDMIRINKDKQIVEIQTAFPCTNKECPIYGGDKPASYVLEINAGLTKKRGIKIGQTTTIKI